MPNSPHCPCSRIKKDGRVKERPRPCKFSGGPNKEVSCYTGRRLLEREFLIKKWIVPKTERVWPWIRALVIRLVGKAQAKEGKFRQRKIEKGGGEPEWPAENRRGKAYSSRHLRKRIKRIKNSGSKSEGGRGGALVPLRVKRKNPKSTG